VSNSSDIDVLVVDDTAGAAEDYASIISSGTGLRVKYTDKPERALQILRETSVKVLVLDQRMPILGTDLFLKVREFDRNVRAIMLTSEAEPQEVGQALRLGFADYVAKNTVRDALVPAVRHEYAQYQAALADGDGTGEPLILRTKSRGLPWSRSEVFYRLRGIAIVDDNYVPDDQWTTHVTVHVGQTERVSISRSHSEEIMLGAEATELLSTHCGLSMLQLATIKTQLSSQIQSRRSQHLIANSANESTIERSYGLPPEPDDPNRVHVRARRVQTAQTFRVARVELRAECTCCKHSHVLSFNVLEPTGKTAVRHEDFLSDDKRTVHRLGYE